MMILGAAAQGQNESALGPWAAVATPANARARTACYGRREVREAVRARAHDEADQALWIVVVQSLARALEYDYRL